MRTLREHFGWVLGCSFVQCSYCSYCCKYLCMLFARECYPISIAAVAMQLSSCVVIQRRTSRALLVTFPMTASHSRHRIGQSWPQLHGIKQFDCGIQTLGN
jgi:hypothetical protein